MLKINGRVFTQQLTGVQRYAYEVVSRLENHYTVLAPSEQKLDYSGIDCKITLGTKGMNGHLWEQLVLPIYKGNDALWSPGGIGPVFGSKNALTIHDLAHIEHPEWYSRNYSRLYQNLYPKAARNAEVIFCVSNFTADKLHRIYGVNYNKIIVTPLGVNEIFQLNPLTTKKNILAKHNIRDRYILFVGATSRRKNLEILLEAWEQVSHKIKDVNLIIAGPQELRFTGYKANIRTNSRIKLIGSVTDNDLVDLYNNADAFIYPSLYEGFGIPPLEAMACGCPVIASNITSIPEVLDNAPLYIDPYSADSISSAIERVLRNPSLASELSEKGIKRASKFKWEVTAQITSHGLERII